MEMTKKQKIESLATAMTTSKRDGEENSFYHFSDTAPRELTDIFLEHYEVRDLDYEIFSRACDIVSQIYAEDQEGTQIIEDAIYEHASGSADFYNHARLGYLNIWNQDEISEHVRDLNMSITDAAAYWYEKEVENAAILIKDWVNA